MSQTGTEAWWADVQHLRDAAERTDEARRRADLADLAARRASRERGAGAPRRSSYEAPIAPRRSGYDVNSPQRRAAAATAVAADAPRPVVTGAPGGVAGRRTVEIRGRTVPAPAIPRTTLELDRRRPPRRAVERVGPRPDRLAMWALLMGIVLILVAVTTADAASVASVAGH